MCGGNETSFSLKYIPCFKIIDSEVIQVNLKLGLGIGLVALLLIVGTVFAVTAQPVKEVEQKVATSCSVDGGCGCGCSSTEGCTSCGCSSGLGCSEGGCGSGCSSCNANLK